MKSGIRIAAFAAAVACMLSCSKEGTEIFPGNYSFKTSGTVKVDAIFVNRGENSEDDTEIQLLMDMQLLMEQGQMNVISKDDDRLLVTMNVLGGDVYTTDATVQGNTLILEPYTRYVRLEFPDFGHKYMPVTVTGTAEKYEDNVIFTLAYSGVYEWESGDMSLHAEIVSSDIRTVARQN